MNYQIPSWLQPRGDDPAAAFVSAFHASAAVAQENARLQQQSEQASMQLAVKQQEMERDSMRQQQMLEMEKAYKEAEIGLRKSGLDEAQQKINLTAQSAASKFAAQQKYHQMVAGGTAPDEAALAVGPELFGSMSGFGQVAKELNERTHPFQPSQRSVTVNGDEVPLVQMSPNRYAFAPKGTSASGDIQAGQVIGPDGAPIPGMVSVGNRAMNIPRHTVPSSLLKEQVKMEQMPSVGKYLSGDTPPPKPGSMLYDQYVTTKKAYDRLRKQIDNIGGNAPAPSASSGSQPVLMKNSKGQTVEVPPDKLDWARQNGYAPAE